MIQPNAENVGEAFAAAKECIDSIPPVRRFTIAIDSNEWLCVGWYRWYFSEDAGMMVSYSWDWSLRYFWKVDIVP